MRTDLDALRIWDHWRGPDYVDGFNAGIEAAQDRLEREADQTQNGDPK